MDKTVRLWHLSSKSFLKVFSHSNYVTCIQFNPADDRYFISGSLDAKVHIWSIPDRQVADWNVLHEMATAACYTPNGEGALVGSYKGSCCLYNTFVVTKSSNQSAKQEKKSHQKKITGFQFAPGSSSKVHIISADLRIQVIDCVGLVRKFKGRRGGKFQPKPKVQIEREKPSADTSHPDAVESIPCPQQDQSIPSETKYMNELFFIDLSLEAFDQSFHRTRTQTRPVLHQIADPKSMSFLNQIDLCCFFLRLDQIRSLNQIDLSCSASQAPEELPKKTKLFFAHAAENWDAEFYAKVNDDVYINIDS
ncbi:WD repeat-containing protein 44 [Camellia lanceoleosa]|uniref:WD repeat-containing protein 44 n=1 Tax=Camellia lanceoleosa TaxID=1840588 RepID=A0ACC0F3K5_9ERIC|nr:WD repeat-containing protein 44 [Camellia lanceoleosa]